MARLAEYDERVWLLVVGVSLLLLAAGVLAAVRTPGRGVAGCAVRLGAATGVALAVLVRLTRLSADASLAVLGVDVVDAGVELRGDVPYALLLGAVWGALAGGAGAVLAGRRRAAAVPVGDAAGDPAGGGAGRGLPVDPGAPTAPYGAGPGGPGGPGAAGAPPEWAVPYLDPDVSWDVTVTGIPPAPPRHTRPPQRPPFTPPPPPGAPPPPKPPVPPAPPH